MDSGEGATKRKRGRPVGSTGRHVMLNKAYLQKLFKQLDFEPGRFLTLVAAGQDKSMPWGPRDRIKAAAILMAHTYDKPARESEMALIEQLRHAQQQNAPVYEIVYVQDSTNQPVST